MALGKGPNCWTILYNNKQRGIGQWAAGLEFNGSRQGNRLFKKKKIENYEETFGEILTNSGRNFNKFWEKFWKNCPGLRRFFKFLGILSRDCAFEKPFRVLFGKIKLHRYWRRSEPRIFRNKYFSHFPKSPNFRKRACCEKIREYNLRPSRTPQNRPKYSVLTKIPPPHSCPLPEITFSISERPIGCLLSYPARNSRKHFRVSYVRVFIKENYRKKSPTQTCFRCYHRVL